MVGRNTKRVLSAVFAAGLEEGGATAGSVAEKLGREKRTAATELKRLSDEGYLSTSAGKTTLTEKGRRAVRVVFIGGGFEVIHQGHLYTIRKAKALGDLLVVSVARDSTIRKRKHREPVAGEKERSELLSSLREVDAAILGVEGDIYETLEKVSPDVVALGYDQYHMESEVYSEARKRGLNVEVVRLDSPYPKMKTSSLLNDF